MNVFGTFAVFVLLFVIYQFLSTIYHSARRSWREGFKSSCECSDDNCRNGRFKKLRARGDRHTPRAHSCPELYMGPVLTP